MKLVLKMSKPPDFSRLLELRDVACKIAEEEEEQLKVAFPAKKRAAPRLSCSRPEKKFRSSDEAEKLHGWVESATHMCSSPPLASGQKVLTRSDVKAKSNRFLLTRIDCGGGSMGWCWATC